ncbi:hypothetical protein CRYUN_Cryun05aG0074200 [Craigia yunnanensis]
MLAENLVDPYKPVRQCPARHQLNFPDADEDFDVHSEEESEDDEQTIEEDEVLITGEERQEELAALHSEIDLPLEDLLKRYAVETVNRESSLEKGEDGIESILVKDDSIKCENLFINFVTFAICIKVETTNLLVCCSNESNGELSISENHSLDIEASSPRNLSESSGELAKEDVPSDFNDEQEDGDFTLAGEEKDDETMLSEEEELTKADSNNPIDEILLLQKESEIPVEELLAGYKKDFSGDNMSGDESEYASALSENILNWPAHQNVEAREEGITKDENLESTSAQGVSLLPAEKESKNRIADAAARSAQPTGNTFLTTNVRTKFPFLLKPPLREYQHIGLDWLVTMYEKRLNGILADEMGLGKTIMTIALLAHLACEKGIWGPHLIVVPTSVMLNWKTEFLRWCPTFKILTYFGSAKERKFKRQGWLKQTHFIWQTLLNFNSKRRILLTGTPLQNDLMELWSLMHFLMPHVFQSHQEFKDWFSNPISGMIEGQERVNKEVVDRLHDVFRPFILRRLKKDVEKQLPMKQEHAIYCRLSRRQRNLYEDFIVSSETQATLASANFFGMISVIMQLRKVCNHPDLFEGRPIDNLEEIRPFPKHLKNLHGTNIFEEIQKALRAERLREAKQRAASIAWWNSLRCRKKPVSSTTLRELLSVKHPAFNIHRQKADCRSYLYSSKLAEIVLSPVERFQTMIHLVESFKFAIPAARAPAPVCWCSKTPSVFLHPTYIDKCGETLLPNLTPIRPAIVRRQVYFPDKRLIQFDCGKLQELEVLLRRLKSEGHRALIFTQMTKMLDILETFINLYGYTYMRLDGSTQPEKRQTLMQRFNTNPKIFLFILSTRSVGVGVNLVGADTIIIYDSDWNPAMDQQAQDRCHRIGQTCEVHIYRLICESTIEENIL